MNAKDFNSLLFSVNDTYDADVEGNSIEFNLSDDTILYYGDFFTDTRFVVNY